MIIRPVEHWLKDTLHLDLPPLIRKIQADAIRWAINQIKDDVNTPGSRKLRAMANQLDPKGKP